MIASLFNYRKIYFFIFSFIFYSRRGGSDIYYKKEIFKVSYNLRIISLRPITELVNSNKVLFNLFTSNLTFTSIL